MPNIKSAKKRVVVTKVKTLQNKMFKSAFKTMMKKYEAAINAGDKDTANALYASVIKKVDQAAAKGIIHKNAAARKKSQYTTMLNKLGA
ncbi:MAG: 30S ribosomal protein S20 [Ruminococcaceae bacterium]|nr:30S ribosomal protein S20 [Oscillospiraceae bacterium]